ncbi:MAG: threonine synthase [Deltaproteobacteria bacterium]|nr:threonine synthase [Deltaproteobacteria bacterium]
MRPSRFTCSVGCGGAWPLTEVIYRCSRCGGLLEVAHDLASLGQVSAREWKARFAERSARARLPEGSGIWGKREWVMPHLEDGDIVSLGEGWNPLLPLPGMAQRLGLSRLELKQCGVSPTGSFKDLGMTVLVSQVRWMRRQGVPLRAVACASTGDTSAALAAYAAAAGIPSVVFLPQGRISPAQLVQPLANGSLVLSLDTDFDGCMRLVREVTADAGLYLANSMNPLRLEGQKILAVELCQQWDWEVPDWVVIPGGNLGNASALGMGFELLLRLGLIDRRPRIAVAQAERANPLARAYRGGTWEKHAVVAGETLASAIQIGDPVSWPRAVRVLQAFNGVVDDASEAELSDAAAEADREGAFACPHTGVALAVTARLARSGVMGGGSRVVVISTAHGLKFPAFKAGYHATGGAPWANPPQLLPADAGAIKAVLDQRLAAA